MSETALPTILPPMGEATPQQQAVKGQTHWVWTPYRDINNMGPIEIRSQLGYRNQRWTVLKRCTPYPLGNLTSSEVDREAASASTGFNVSSDSLPRLERVKFAQDQAAELGQSYANDGLRVLLPFLGMDDTELVGRIFLTVQPFEYEVHEMAEEFTSGAEKRIRESNLSDADKDKARAVARIMLNGAKAAETKALAEYEALISSMSDKMAGGQGISNPSTAYQSHAWVCQQINKPVPARIDRTGGSAGSGDAINILAKRALQEESAAESMAAQLAEERAERIKLESKIDALLAAQEPKTSAKQPRA
jgi:hypothetical protein